MSLNETHTQLVKGTYETGTDVDDILRYQENQRIHLPGNRDGQFRCRGNVC